MSIARRAAAAGAGGLFAFTVAVGTAGSASATAAAPTCDQGAPTSVAYTTGFETAGGASRWGPPDGYQWNWLSSGTPGTTTHAGHGSLWGRYPLPTNVSGSWTADMTTAVQVPPGPAFLTFWHREDFATGTGGTPLNGGQLSASTDGGATWYDLGPRMIDNPYTATIPGPYGPEQAFAGQSAGWNATRVDLSTMAGLAIKLRFQLRINQNATSNWYIDDLALYGCAPVPPTSRMVLDTNPNLSATQVLARQPGSNAVLGATFSGRPTTAWTDLGGKTWAAPAADTKTG